MTALVWDQPGEKEYQTGVDRGVLYLHDGTVAVWNGLTKVEESPSGELRSYYLDGRKYLEYLSPGDFSGVLTAFTYPDEFDVINGVLEVAPGLSFHDQPAKSFNLSYRTKIGNDLDGTEGGYKLHILYNVIANPNASSFDTLSDSVQPTEFSWILSGKPVTPNEVRPTSHISIDSTKAPTENLQQLESTLYGDGSNDPQFLSIEEVGAIFV